MLNLITDRTLSDVQNKTDKGYYNESDLNRVGEAVQYLADALNGYGYAVTVSPKTDWVIESIPNATTMTRYINDLVALKTAFYGTTELPPRTVSVANIITNGNYENGATGWDNIGLSSMTVTNGVMTTVANSFAGRPSQAVDCTLGHTYYIQSRFKTISPSVSLALTRLDRADLLVAHSGSGNFETLSARGVITSDISVSMFILDYRSSAWTATDIDYMLAIDLTAAFGAGSEPTKAWCDANISYFDGAKTLIQAMDNLTVEDANNIEKLLLELEANINHMVAGFRKSGKFKSGQGVKL